LEPIRLANQEISKGFTGVSGMFDEKSFVGAAEVQERVVRELMLSFERFIMFDINDALIPRMQKLGSFPDREFMWRADDILTTEQKVESIVALSPYYEITTEEVSKSTGIEIESTKEEEVEPTSVAAKVKELYNTFDIKRND